MERRSFNQYAHKRIGKDEVTKIENQVKLENKILKSLQSDISKAIESYLKTHNMTFIEFAKKANLKPSQINKLKQKPPHLTLETLAHLFALLETEPELVFKIKSPLSSN